MSKVNQYNTNHSNCSFRILSSVLFVLLFISCQKELKLRTGIAAIKQVINCNFTPDDYIYINISKSKRPDDFNSVEFLQNCTVELYEDGLYKETLPFILKDTSSGLGFYTSMFKPQPNKTYKIISSHPELGIAEATEFLPPYPDIVNHALLQHADSATPSKSGYFILAFQDSANVKNYYFLNCFYRVLKPTVNESGDTTYVYDYIWNVPPAVPEYPNLTRSPVLYFDDNRFDGQLKILNFSFPSKYNTAFKEILFIVELSNLGTNSYEWNVQQQNFETDYLNEGQNDRTNLKSNIINGFGHFSARSSRYLVYPIR